MVDILGGSPFNVVTQLLTEETLMIDVMQTNEKLVTRAENIVMTATKCNREVVKDVLKRASGSVRVAVTMILLDCE